MSAKHRAEKWTIEKCPCGHKSCKDYHIPQLGMVQGGMLDLETALFIVRACKAHDYLVEALNNIAHHYDDTDLAAKHMAAIARAALAKAKK